MAIETPYYVTKNNVVIEEVIEEFVIDTFDIINNVFRMIHSDFIIIIYKLPDQKLQLLGMATFKTGFGGA